jgi:hypothetical protein
MLGDFLLASQKNIAVLPDQLAMELFKGDGRTNIQHSLKILANFPKQIVVLRSTHRIIAIRSRRSGLHARFADAEQTAGFVKYCRFLFRGSEPRAVDLDRQRKQFVANRRYNNSIGDIASIRAAILQLKANYTPAELKALRSRKPIEGDFWIRFCNDVFNASIQFMADGKNAPLPTSEELLYSYVFRYALCAYARAVDWISLGGYEAAPNATLMNDYTDMAYAAYATFYDGLLTKDKKLDEIYTFARRLLVRVFFKAEDLVAEAAQERSPH